MSCSVHNDAASEHEVAAFWEVENPFLASHSVSLPSDPLTTAAAEYDISWLLDYGNFLIDAEVAAEGTSTSLVHSLAGGSIYVQPTTDLPLELHAAFLYDLPADWMQARLKMSVYQAGAPPPFLFHEELRADTFPGEPSSGTLTIDGDIVLPAGGTWIMKYNMEVLAWPGTTGHLATGSGFAHFTISPEPSSLLLLSLTLPVCLRHSRRCRWSR